MNKVSTQLRMEAAAAAQFETELLMAAVAAAEA
jgi:hypothetical protein